MNWMNWTINLTFLAGSIALVIGLAQLWPPLAWIAVGVMLMGASFLIHFQAQRRAAVLAARSPRGRPIPESQQ